MGRGGGGGEQQGEKQQHSGRVGTLGHEGEKFDRYMGRDKRNINILGGREGERDRWVEGG